ncbi:MAG: hypothetical protein AAFR11_04770 [Pseudomonadota bacterium]
MSAYEIMDLIASQLSIINEVWNFFLTIHMAVIGLLIIARQYVPWAMKLVVITAYLGFLGVNYSAQIDNYTRLEALYEQAGQREAAGEYSNGAMAYGDLMRDYGVEEPKRFLPIVYSFSAGMTILCLAFVNTVQGRHRDDD